MRFQALCPSVDEPNWPITTKLIEQVRDRSIEIRSKDVVAPPLSEEMLAERGARNYAEMCAGCHGAPGVPENELQRGRYPQPPSLDHRMDPRRAFWVIKHGVKLTGMPAWGASHDDEAIWNLVAFIGRLPGMSPEQYQALVAKAPRDAEAAHGLAPAAAPAGAKRSGAGESPAKSASGPAPSQPHTDAPGAHR